MFDVAIIGSGPAGVSAAINLKILNKSFIWYSSRTSSKKVERSHLIKNYPAFPEISGEKLNEDFLKHAQSLGIEINEEVVTGVYETDGYFTLLVQDKSVEAKSVILCLGVEAIKPIDGEEEFLGRGVSYCATCDGFLYKGKKIAVLITDKKFEHEAKFLCGLAEKTYLIPLYKGYEAPPDAEVILKAPKKLSGGMKIEKIDFGSESIEVDGLFILRGAVTPKTLLRGLKVEDGHIAVNRNMETNIDGIFAAGDCTGRPYQIAKAVGEGNIAAHSAVEYLDKKVKA